MQQQRGKTVSTALGPRTRDKAPQAVTRPSRSEPGAAVLGDPIAFLRGFLEHPKEVGSVVPSSAYLEQRLAQMAGIDRAQTVVELGPGTGGTTRALLRALGPDATLLAIELSAMFHARLLERVTDRRLIVQLGSAEHLSDILRARRLPAPDAIVSGIPFSTMSLDLGNRIAAAIEACLAPGGRFVAYQVRGHVADRVSPYLGPAEVAWEARNIPPLRVYRWVKRSC